MCVVKAVIVGWCNTVRCGWGNIIKLLGAALSDVVGSIFNNYPAKSRGISPDT